MEFSTLDIEALSTAYAAKITEMATQYGVRLLGALILIVVAIWLSAKAKKWVTAAMERARIDVTLAKFFGQATRWSVLTIAGISMLGIFGVQTASFAAVIAASGLAIGLAFQGTLANVASGVMLLIFRPFRVGHYIKVSGEQGTVDVIDLFTTHLNTPDNRRIILPNSQVFGASIENVSYHPLRRMDITIGVAYDADLDKTRAVLNKVAGELENVLKDPEPAILLTELGASSVDWTMRLWTQTDNYWILREATLVAVKKALDEAGIGIPFPQMDVHLFRDS